MKRRKRASALEADQRPAFALLILVLALAAAPLLSPLPTWIPTTALGLLALRMLALWRRRPMPPGWLLAIAGLASVLVVFAQFHALNGRDPGVSLLLLGIVLKAYEVRSRRDLIVLIYLGYLLGLAYFLFNQSIPWVAYALLQVVALTALLARLHAGPQAPHWRELSLSGVVRLLSAVPLMLLLFALFPRIEGPLWGHSAQQRTAITGLSNELAPGGITQLVQSHAVAFWASFATTPPPTAQRYWRVHVMTRFNGRQWSAAPQAASPSTLLPEGPRLKYTLLLQATDQHWVPALDMPERAPPGVRLKGGHTLRAQQPIDRVRKFTLSAVTHSVLAPSLSSAVRRADLALPPGIAPRARALALRWRRQEPSAQDIVSRALRYIHDQPFYYTLHPPPLQGDITDDFLFGTRRGFCEDYASAFAVLMRAAGIPARIVTGYAGGQWNPVLHYLVVRQSNAHAWVEVWLKKRGWVRVDPTAAVSAKRVQRGIATGTAQAPIAQGSGFGPLQRWAANLRMSWNSVQYFWDSWVVAFGPQQQRAFLHRLGLQADWFHLALYMGVGSGLLILLWFGVSLLPRGERPDAPTRLYRRHLRQLARQGLNPTSGEGAFDFAERAARRLPQQADHIRQIAALYSEARYAGGDKTQRQRRLHRLAEAVDHPPQRAVKGAKPNIG